MGPGAIGPGGHGPRGHRARGPWARGPWGPGAMGPNIGESVSLLTTVFIGHVFSLGELGSKSLHYYITFRVHISETSIKADSKFELRTPVDHFELLAEVL